MRKTNYSNNIIITKKCLIANMLRSVIFGILLLCLAIISLYKESYAKTNKLSDDEYVKACEAALMVIQPINEEKLEVHIGNIYNVVDIEGNLDGLSLGYFVGEEPYGYAIYNIKNSSIREFVFSENEENLYSELVDKAEEYDNINKDKIMDEIIYEGGIDYCVCDEEGNKIEYINDEENIIENNEEINFNNNITESKYKKGIGELCNSINYDKIYSNSTSFLWDCVPDSGLTMITQNYSTEKFKKYCCGVTAMTGILNWMGYSSIDYIYNDLWDNTVTYQTYENGVVYGGVYPSDITNYVNTRYFAGSNTQAYQIYPTFNDIIRHITNYSSGEKAPFYLSINVKEIDSDTGEYKRDPKTNEIITEGHAVVGVSYITSKENSKENQYVGIWNSWFIDPNDNETTEENLIKNVDNNSAYRSIRYINFSDLTNNENVSCETIMFNNIRSKNIKEPRINYLSGNQIELGCVVPNGTVSVAFPTWTEANGQDDLIWHSGIISSGNYASCIIDLNTHNKESGKYITHIYACDNTGTTIAIPVNCYYVSTTISDVNVKKNSVKGYTVSCKLPTGTVSVKFPTWTEANGQDDLIWYSGTVSNGSGKVTIDVANHNNEGGKYITHIYAYDKYNNIISCVGTNVFLINRSNITSAKLDNSIDGKIICSCYAPMGADYVTYEVMATNIGRLGHKSFKQYVSSSNGYIKKNIYKSDFYDTTGEYLVRIHAFNSKGQLIGNCVDLLSDMR